MPDIVEMDTNPAYEASKSNTIKMDNNPAYGVSTSGTVKMVEDDPAYQTMSAGAGSDQRVEMTHNPAYDLP